jgi:hypothetical protein
MHTNFRYEDADGNETTPLKQILKPYDTKAWTEFISFRASSVANSCELSYDPSGFMKAGDLPIT